MKIGTRHGVYELDMGNIASYRVVDTRLRSKVHFGWWVVIFLIFWPGLLAYPFVPKRKVITVEVETKDGDISTHDIYQEGLDKMGVYRRDRTPIPPKKSKYY